MAEIQNSEFISDNFQVQDTRWCIQKFPDWVDNEINNDDDNKHSLRRNTKGYEGKTH
jgi:hypothetical protein